MNDSINALHPDDISSLEEALRAADPEGAVLAAIHRISLERLSVVVFSASRCLAAKHELERIYSSDPVTYPVRVPKSKRGTPWARHVLQQRQVFVGEGALEMAAAFDDQDQMERLGIHSIINVPVALPAGGLAVLNFGRAPERVPPADVARARLLGLVASAGFALARS